MGKINLEEIIGAWRLCEYSLEDKSNFGKRFYPLGEDATGFLMYTPDGYVSAHLMASGRPSYASGRLHTGSTEEMAQAAKGYMAYAGKFEIDPHSGVLIHHLEVSMNPTWLGQAQERIATISENRLIITAPANNALLIWERAGK